MFQRDTSSLAARSDGVVARRVPIDIRNALLTALHARCADPRSLETERVVASWGKLACVLVLSPPAEDLADLVVRMCQLPWPTTEQDRRRYFSELELTDGDVADTESVRHNPETRLRDLTTALPGSVGGNCSTFRGQFLGLSLFAYSQREPNGQPARQGYAALRHLLSQVLGDPLEEWGPVDQPACLWRVGVLTLDMYCFQQRHSGIMVGPSHTPRSAANDAASIKRGHTRP